MSDDLCFTPAVDLAGLLRRREVSARELLDAHLDRINRVNESINAIVTLDVDGARAAADEADRVLASGAPVGPLHGLPVAHKDTHGTAGMRTTHGSPLLADRVPDSDDLVVSRLKAAGAVRVGKTNVPEWAAGSHTFNPVFGVTRNPYSLEASAGGSSGGAAAALAAGLVPLAEGSDMGGSLRNPAAFCNVVGFRPTPGRVPDVPESLGWQTLSVLGPMGRTVADVMLMLSVIAGPDPRAPLSLDEPGDVFAPPGSREPRDLRGLRVAWTPDLGGRIPVEPAVIDALGPGIGVFEELGATVAEDCPDLTGADEVFDVLRAWQFALWFGEVVRDHPDAVKQAVRWNVALGEGLTGADVGRAMSAQTRLHARVVEFFDRYDVLLSPTTQVLPFAVDLEYPTEICGRRMTDYLGWMRSCSLISATGTPALSVPGGFSPDGLPVGLQVIGAPRADHLVLAVGHAFEQATRFGSRRPSLRGPG